MELGVFLKNSVDGSNTIFIFPTWEKARDILKELEITSNVHGILKSVRNRASSVHVLKADKTITKIIEMLSENKEKKQIEIINYLNPVRSSIYE